MELDRRKLQILKAVIDEYILSATPVGSRSISKNSDIRLSSATIRNEMADLEEMGYLEQPHTSAGRIPSDKAYRLYVDQMMRKSQLSVGDIGLIKQYYTRQIDDLEKVFSQTAQALSDATRYTAFVLPPALDSNHLRHLQLVPLTEGRALMIVVTESGFARESILEVPRSMTTEELEQLSRMLTKRLYGRRLDSISGLILGEMTDELLDRRGVLNDIADAVRRQINSGRRKVEISGTTNMLHYPEYSALSKARSFLSAVEEDDLFDFLKKNNGVEFTITIGAENEAESLRDCSVVTATYRSGNMPLGSFGIIGPTRMNYGKVVSVLEYIQECMKDILGNYIDEGE